MADVCVVGGGPAGLAVAARAAKNGHTVTLVDAASHLGGRLRTQLGSREVVETGAADMVLPATLRDLYRKTGRPLERELSWSMVEGTREHRELVALGDLGIPLTGRGAQQAAVAEVAGPVAADLWTGAVDRAGELWTARHADWETLPHSTHDTFRLTRVEGKSALGQVLKDAASIAGASHATVPGLVASRTYLEQALGIWRPEGGSVALADSLVTRLSLRGVTVHTGDPVSGLLARADGSVGGIRTAAGNQHADVVVLTVGIPELRAILNHTPRVRRLRPIRYRLRFVRSAPVPRVTLATVDQDRGPSGFETVFHRQSAVVRRHMARADGIVGLTIRQYRTSPAMPLDTDSRVAIPQPPFAFGPSLASIRRLGLLPHIHGQVPGLMLAGPSTHLAGPLATELLSAAIAAEALGSTSR